MSRLSLLFFFYKNQLITNQVALCHISIGKPRIILRLIVTRNYTKMLRTPCQKGSFSQLKIQLYALGFCQSFHWCQWAQQHCWAVLEQQKSISLPFLWAKLDFLFYLMDCLYTCTCRVFIQRREGASKIEKKSMICAWGQAFQQFFTQFLTINLKSLIPIF